VIRPDGPPWRAALVLALALFGWVAAPRDPRGRRLHRHAVENLNQADALLLAGELRNDGITVAAAGADGSET